MLIFLPLALVQSGCDVHEFPDVPESREFKVNIKYHPDFTAFTKWEHLYDEDKVYEIGLGEKYNNILSKGIARYVIHAYPKSAKQRALSECVKEFVFTRDIAEGYNCEFTLGLAPGQYTIMVWSDFIRYREDSYFYNATDFAEISFQGEHQGNTDYRDAFKGMADVALPADIFEHETIVLDIDMQRPLAKYEFITTDLKEFIGNELELLKREAMTKGEEPPTKVDTDSYRVVFYYSGFMPDTYNMHSDKPVDSKMGVMFESKLNILGEQEASLGFDYVFVNGNETVVPVQIALFNDEGKQISLTEPIDVPLKRNHHTILRGSFLSAEASGGIKINPDFDGEHNVII